MAPLAGRREVPCFAFKGEAGHREGGAAPASGPGDTRARCCLVNGRNSDAPRTRQAIVTIEEPRPSIRCCGPDGSCARRTADWGRCAPRPTTTNPSSNLVCPLKRDSPHWLPEFVDDVEVITRGDGTGGVQQIGLAAVRGRPNACELAMPLLIVQRTPIPAHAMQPKSPGGRFHPDRCF